MTSSTGKQIIAIYIYPNISVNKDNNNIWSVNRVQHKRKFFLKNYT